jgi:hypothetical protein
MIAMIQARAQRMGLPSWPAFGLADTGASEWLSGSGEDQNGQVLTVRVDYRLPGARERLIVQTQPLTPSSPNLSAVLRQLQAGDDDGEPLQLSGNDTAEHRNVPLRRRMPR